MRLVLLTLLSVPWLIPAAGFLRSLERKGYPLIVGDVLLSLFGFLGLAGLGGQTALRTWMVWPTVAAAVVLWMVAALALPVSDSRPVLGKLKPHLIFAIVWGTWMAYNAYMVNNATALRFAQEAANIKVLGTVRSAVMMYRTDTGKFPARLEDLVPNSLHRIPPLTPIAAPDRILHKKSDVVHTMSAFSPDDSGGWGYVPETGTVFMNCTHPDAHATKRLSDY